jgi:hypothetical protein
VFDLHVEGEPEVRRRVMGTRKYRMVVAALLTGVALFSPLLCGMTCLEERGIEQKSGAEFALPAEELVVWFAESGVVGCLLTRVVPKIDLSEWAERVYIERWFRMGVQTMRVFGRVWGGGVSVGE